MQSDNAHRDMAIHWPVAYAPPVAPVFSHNETPNPHRLPQRLTSLADDPNWPNWFVMSKMS